MFVHERLAIGGEALTDKDNLTMSRIVTGIKPSGTPHVGNYFGMIEPALGLAQGHDATYFVADYHALTTVRDPEELRDLTLQVTATWIALGLDPNRSVLYLQSDLPEVCELAWLLGCVMAKGLLNRGHAYKSAVDDNLEQGRPVDDGVNAGLYNYPLLMAADLLLHRADLVPVGEDNRQHVEICRDVATAFNHNYGAVLAVPELRVQDGVAVIAGTDGRKMSKSYSNVVPIFASTDEVRRTVMSIVTDSSRPEDPKDPDACNVFNLYRHLAAPEDARALAVRYRTGGIGYREAKELVAEAHEQRFAGSRDRYLTLMDDPGTLRQTLHNGAERARDACAGLLAAARAATGILAGV
ncbi:MAG TPA: tryptophan--tRNA ligase [Acidimicrobiales bacterium]|nr:tryptophan--tRNA ligase [Acidimicrobiales bacterium]